METKHLDIQITKATSADYDARFVMSASAPDRVGDTIEPKAYDAAIRKTGDKLIALYQHDPDRPVGFWTNLKHEGGQLVGDLKLASTNLGKMIKELIASGVPLGASIGFRGRGDETAKGFHFKEIELLETSVVSIPCHPAAMQIAKQYNFELPNEPVDALDGTPASGHNAAEAVIKRAKAAILATNRTLNKRK